MGRKSLTHSSLCSRPNQCFFLFFLYKSQSVEPFRTPLKFKQPYSTEYKLYVFEDIYVDISHLSGMFDALDDMYYDIFNDMIDDI